MQKTANSKSSTFSFFFYIFVLICGISLRLFLISFKPLCNWLQNRVEISTPLTSWSRVEEGLYLKNELKSSAYDGDLVHEIPLMLYFFKYLITMFSTNYISYLFVIIDLINGILVHRCRLLLKTIVGASTLKIK